MRPTPWIALVLVLAATACADDSGTTDSGSGTGDGDGDTGDAVTVTGVVLDAAGGPVSGATVTALGDAEAAPATTDASGSYSLQVAAGVQDASVEARGFVPGLERFDARAGATADFELLATADFDAALSSLGRTQQAGFGIVRVNFQGAGGGESATVAGTTDTPFAIVGDSVVESEVLPGGATSLFFTNVDPGFTGLTDVSSPDCTPRFDDSYLVGASTIVVVNLDC